MGGRTSHATLNKDEGGAAEFLVFGVARNLKNLFLVQPYSAGEKCRDKMVAGSNQQDAAVRAAVMKIIKALDVQQV